MTSLAIRAEGLSKSYLIRHQQREAYLALRDVLANQMRGLWSRLRYPLGGFDPGDQHQEELWALRDVSFDIAQGERIGIIGRNAAGKSTLLKLLSRITEPTSGRLAMKGRVASLLEVGTGFHPELSGRENVFLNGAILGMSRAEIRRKFEMIVEFAEVERFLDTPVKRYSSGMYVRLAFAVAAHLEPEILVVDEVLAVGDAEFQRKCIGRMGEVAKEGRTVLFVSHNMAAIRSLCERGILLDRGALKADGPATSVIDDYLRSLAGSPTAVLTDRPRSSPPNSPRFTSINVEAVGGGVIYSSSALEITLGYTGGELVGDATFAIGIYDFSGAEVYLLDTESAGAISALLPGCGVVKCTTGPLNMTAGSCYINLALIQGRSLQGGGTLDYVDHAAVFDVEASDFYGTAKMPPRNWSLCLTAQQWEFESRSPNFDPCNETKADAADR